MTDRKRLYIFSISTLAVLLTAFLIPFDIAGRVISAIAFVFAAVIAYLFIKKRPILSMNKRQVLMLVSLLSAILLMVFYLSGLKFGFYNNPYGLKAQFFFPRFLPTVAVIVASEIFRYILLAQENKRVEVICYFACLAAELTVCSTAAVALSSFSNFMDLVADTMFPAMMSGLLYQYMAKRYGYLPNIVLRAATSLYIYLIPIVPAMANSLLSFIRILLPIGIYIVIDSLYEKKIMLALGKKSKLAVPITVIAIAIMLFVVMVVSNHFYIGSYVIATESMTGELNRGDVAITFKYTDQPISEGQVVAFEQNDRVVIHRVVKIEVINGQRRYYTKGDANDDIDSGFITDSNIVGLVDNKIPFLGYPTLWMRSLFER
jgi:signal peptidase